MMMAEKRISVGWGDADCQVLVWIFHEHWQEDDFIYALQKAKKLCKDETNCYILVDYRNANPPPNVIPLLRYGLTNWSKHIRGVIIINERKNWRILFPLVGSIIQVFSSHIYYVNSVDAAYGKIHQFLNGDGSSDAVARAATS